MRSLRQSGDIEGLARREVDAAQEDGRELARAVADRGLEVVRPDGRLADPWLDDDQVRRGVEASRREVAGNGVAIGWEQRAVDEDPASRAARPEERDQEQVEIDRQRVGDRDLVR